MSDLDLESMVVQLAEAQRSRHFGKHRGIVTDIGDPDGLGRICVKVPGVYGDRESPWAMPALPFAGALHGLVLLPEVGDRVWVEFEGGDISRPIWSGCWWTAGQRPSPRGEKVRLLATSGGHQLILDEDGNTIRLVHPGGAEIALTADAITLTMGTSEIKMTASEISLNHGMIKVTTAGVSLVNDAMKLGA